MRWLYASEAPVSMRQPDTDTVYTTPGMQELYGQCFVCGLCVVCVCEQYVCEERATSLCVGALPPCGQAT
jgi:hypothetical protein